MRRAPERDDVEPAAALARGDDSAARPAALHAQHGVEARQPCLGGDRLGADLLVRHADELQPGERPLACGQHARCMCRHGQPALHVRDARPDQAIALAPQRSPRGGAQREHGVVMAEQRDARPPGALQRRMHVQAGGRGHELAREPVARERRSELGRERVELGARSARRVVGDPAGEVAQHEIEICRDGIAHVPGRGDAQRG